jgi:hypothetical protein
VVLLFYYLQIVNVAIIFLGIPEHICHLPCNGVGGAYTLGAYACAAELAGLAVGAPAPAYPATVWGGGIETVLAEHEAVYLALRQALSPAVLDVGEFPVVPNENLGYVVTVVA